MLAEEAVKDVAKAVKANKNDHQSVTRLQNLAGVAVDGLYGPQTAGVVEYLLGQGQAPATTSGRITPYEPPPESGIDRARNGYYFDVRQLEVILSLHNRSATTIDGKWSSSDEQVLRDLIGYDDSFEVIGLEGALGIVVIPGVQSGVLVETTLRSWGEDETTVAGITIPGVDTTGQVAVAMAEVQPAAQTLEPETSLLPAEVLYEPPAVVVNEMGQVIPTEETNFAPAPITVGDRVQLAQESPPKIDTFQAPEFEVTVPESDNAKLVKTLLWVGVGVAVLGIGAYLARPKRRKRS